MNKKKERCRETGYGPAAASSRIRFYNGRICTMADGPEIFTGELWTAGKRVVYAGVPKAAEFSFDKEIDLQGNLLLPGFKNTHTHSAMTFLRSYADDLPLLEWLEQLVFPREAKLEAGDVYHLSKLAILEYLTSGITANLDMYMFEKSIAQASVDCGFRTVLCAPLNNFMGSIADAERNYQELNDFHELIRFKLGFHAEYTCSRELLEQVASLAQKHGEPVYFHNSESKAEVEGCMKRYGMTPTAFLNSLGMFEHGGCAFHAVHMTKEDLAICREKKIAVVSNPSSNSKLASGIAPIAEMLAEGVAVALGTDGPASNNALDMFREMYLVTVLQKLLRQDAAALDAQQVLQMATVTGAKVMGWHECDSLAPGKLADLIVIDLQQPNMQPLNHILKNVVYAGCKQNVKLTMVNGRILYEDGEFYIGTPVIEIYERANEIINALR